MAAGNPHDAEIRLLEAELRKLEAEYNMFFAGQLPRPPWETRASLEAMLKRVYRKVKLEGIYAERFRVQTIQSRYAAFVDLWDRGLRAREEGRPGPFSRRRRLEPDDAGAAGDRVVYVTVFSDPAKEMDKVHELYERLAGVRVELGEAQIPFHKFANLIRDQVKSIKNLGAPEVAFRVSVQAGKIAFTARALKGADTR